jgi:putative lipoic acid-binding regulatory protein
MGMSTNGNSTNADSFNDQKIEFPVTFELKAVMVADGDPAGNKKKLVKVFTKLQIKSRFVADKVSSKGTYISYTYTVTLDTKEQMEKLYEDLKGVEGLKFAL